MLTISNFKTELAAKGVKVFEENGKVILTGKVKAVSPEQIAWIKAHRDALLAMLREKDNPVYRFVSIDGGAEAFSRWKLDPRYWRLAEKDEP